MSNTFTTPAGQYPPLLVVSKTDHIAWIAISAALGIPILVVFGLIRVFVRKSVKAGLDDIIIAVATLFALIQICLVLSACGYGLGKTANDLGADYLARAEKIYYASNIFFIITLALSKASVVALLLRLCAEDLHRRLFRGALGFLAVWMVACVFTIALQCDLGAPWILYHAKCSGLFARWQAIAALDIITELAIVGMAIMLVWKLQTPISTKINIVLGFCGRLILIVFIGIRLGTFPEHRVTSNPTLSLTLFVVWTQTQMNWAIISATIPSLRPFLRGLSTAHGNNMFGSSYGTKPTGYALSDLRQNSRMRSKNGSRHQQSFAQSIHEENSQTGFAFDLGDNRGNNTAFVGAQSHSRHKSAAADDDMSIGSDNSQHRIIRKDVSYTVDHESAAPIQASERI